MREITGKILPWDYYTALSGVTEVAFCTFILMLWLWMHNELYEMSIK